MRKKDMNEIRVNMRKTEKFLSEMEKNQPLHEEEWLLDFRKGYGGLKTDLAKDAALLQSILNQFAGVINRLETSGLGFEAGDIKESVKGFQQDIDDLKDLSK